MKLSEVKSVLKSMSEQDSISIQLGNGEAVEPHFHITEVGMVTKNFIDCGAKIRTEKKINFQLWHADDVDHRLTPAKLMGIIAESQEVLYLSDEEVEVEYQTSSISKYSLEFDPRLNSFVLLSTQTNCLALDKCGIPEDKLGASVMGKDGVEKKKISLKNITTGGECTPGGGCC